MTILYYMLFLMEVDGEITKREEQLVEHFGLLLGFRIETHARVDQCREIIQQAITSS